MFLIICLSPLSSADRMLFPLQPQHEFLPLQRRQTEPQGGGEIQARGEEVESVEAVEAVEAVVAVEA